MKPPRLVIVLVAASLLAGLAACDVPQPPPELRAPTATAADIGRPTASPAPPTPTLPPEGGGRLWFLRDNHVWQTDPTGAQPQQVSALPADSGPASSPDGGQVAFLSGPDLVVIDATRGGERVLVDATQAVTTTDPAGGAMLVLTDTAMAPHQRLGWSADGRQIAYFTFAAQPGVEHIWAATTDGSRPPRLMTTITVPGYQAGPTFERVAGWEPDGRRFAAGGVYGPIQVLPLDASAGDPVTVDGGELDWAPDSRFLLYTQSLNGALALFDLVGRDATPFVNEKREVGTRLGDTAQGPGPRFSPDGTLILYRSRMADGTPAVAVRDLAGVEGLYLPGNNAAWSPDGNWIVYETGNLGTDTQGLGQMIWQPTGLAKVQRDGSNMAQILQDASAPAWGR